jgi:uncharacterized membrane protein YbaN (DUF454 family)
MNTGQTNNNRSWPRAFWRHLIGWTLIVVGIIGLIVPVMPGWAFIGAGALLLAPYIRVFRRFSAWIHKRFPKLRGSLKIFRNYKR